MRVFRYKSEEEAKCWFVELEVDNGYAYGYLIVSEHGKKRGKPFIIRIASLEWGDYERLDDIDLYSVIGDAIEKANANED